MPSELKEAESRAKLALEKYIADVRNSIPPGTGLAGIEAAMMQHNPSFLLEIMQTLDQEQGFSPLRGAQTREPHENRTTDSSDQKRMGRVSNRDSALARKRQ